ncbi:MAG: glycoside hydrolase family 127 protein [Thermoguttaceae bacterium]|nr:glycoside hydrolase family 127 protein [Thermoguttaceae bacterium]
MNKYLSIALTLVLFLTASQSALFAQNSAKPHRQKDEVLSPNKQDSMIPTSKQEPTLSGATPVREDKIHLFSLEDVRITDGRFLQVQELDHEYLLTLEPDRLLSWFRREAGLMQKQEPYPYWESEEAHLGWPLAGHILGFYLSSMSMMYQTTGDARILERLTYVLDELKTCQDANGNGYLLPTLRGKELFNQVHERKFTTNTWAIIVTVDGKQQTTWEPVYVMNKIMLGLYDVYTMCGLEQAKPILVKMADWFGTEIIDVLSHDDIQKLLFCEHGSINESYVNVYELTGDEKYLRWAEKLNDEIMWVPMSKGEDMLVGWHANTQIPKFTGFNAVSKYNGNQELAAAANNFWDIVVAKHTWVNGGNSCGEHFFPQSEFKNKALNYGGPESCNSVNMMRLTESLYQSAPKMERVDYYENVLFNHVLANYETEQGMCVYYTSMRPAHYKMYSTKYDSFWCCTGTGFEAPAKFGKMIYAYNGAELYVNMFIPSALNWKEQGVSLTQSTKYPDENVTTLTVQTKEPKDFSMKIRVPRWIESGSMKIEVNGVAADEPVVDSYITLKRTWMSGDVVKASFEPKFEVAPLVDTERFYSVKYGAIVLASKVPNVNLNVTDFRQARRTVGTVMAPISDAPTLFGTPDEIIQKLKREPGEELAFTYTGLNGKTARLIPFNRIQFSRYAIYFNHAKDLEEYKNKVQFNEWEVDPNLASQTLQSVLIGLPKSESVRQFKQGGNNSLVPLDDQRFWRRAVDGGWFSYTFQKPQGGEKIAVNFTIRVTDQDRAGADVYVNDQKVWSMDRTPETATAISTTFFTKTVSIPEELYKDADSITVKFAAKRGVMTGDITDVRIVREN